jgi:hypothetical protein
MAVKVFSNRVMLGCWLPPACEVCKDCIRVVELSQERSNHVLEMLFILIVEVKIEEDDRS